MKELEVKILDINLNELRNKLKILDCSKVKEENQINDLFDFPNKTLLKKHGYARIRTVEDLLTNSTNFYLTVKTLSSSEKFKVMDENEVEIMSGEEGKSILKALGLELTQSIKKYRESYKYKNALIEIDINEESFCPFPYIEIEAQTSEEIEEVVKALGYTMEDTTSKSIYELIELFKQRKGL
ncbi:adenylate cyclase class 2 [Clostridium pascui]|uniref:class IV adenylate cyclase n=1 Tax=Clostridium pascui TaxID=46609 RepID=UPI00195EC53F|nr:CYTH domain-containing protein [Clostridium pascui]MBM7870534.1 adenylate cyclase class 2 [Clostridium pascui]